MKRCETAPLPLHTLMRWDAGVNTCVCLPSDRRRLLMDKMAKDVSPSTGCRVIAYDRPPFGLSERPLQWDEDSIDPYTVEAGAIHVHKAD